MDIPPTLWAPVLLLNYTYKIFFPRHLPHCLSPTVDLTLQVTEQEMIYYVGLSWDNTLGVLRQEIPFM